MPHSKRDNDADVIQFVKENDVRTVLDVGVGSGTYSDILRPHVEVIDGIEAWIPYSTEFDLKNKYDEMMYGDIRAYAEFLPPIVLGSDDGYDLIIFGDVLEHMLSHESLAVWKWAAGQAKWGLISVPTVHWPQGAVGGNPYERHLQEHLEVSSIKEEYGPFSHCFEYEQTATFIKDFR